MIVKKRKYPDLDSLADAFATGELTPETYRLVVDNDSSALVYVGPVPEDLTPAEADHFRDRKTDEAGEWFAGSGYADVVAACNAAGIPAEWV